jgi:osmotically-inducible protein OsmY
MTITQANRLEKTDTELKTDVLSELQYEPSVTVTDIGVLVKDGIVTLNGYATSYGERLEIVRAVKRVAGVQAIADDLEVKLPDSVRLSDGDIAAAAAHQINGSTTIPQGSVEVTVRDGRVTLNGEVEWWLLKTLAENLVKHLPGVTAVSNLIVIKPKLRAAGIETAIKSAFKRNALLANNLIQVEATGSEVILRGIVRNHAEREEAERVAWAAPGVFFVHNQLTVKWLGFSE